MDWPLARPRIMKTHRRHASANERWIGSFPIRPNRTWRILILSPTILTKIGIGLLLGTTMGVYQMLKSAHFLSHRLVTAVFCWIVFLTLRRLFGVAFAG